MRERARKLSAYDLVPIRRSELPADSEAAAQRGDLVAQHVAPGLKHTDVLFRAFESGVERVAFGFERLLALRRRGGRVPV